MKRILCIVESPTLRVELESTGAAMGSGNQLLFHSELTAGLASLRYETVDVIAVELPADASEIQRWSQLIDSAQNQIPMIGILSDESEQAEGVVVESVRFGIRDFLRRPASASELSEILARLSKPNQVKSEPGQLIAVASTKGGVGKSTISANLAVGLATRFPQQVLLIDGSLQLGVSASLLNLQPTVTLSNIAASVDRLDSTLLRDMALQHQSGLDVIPAPLSPADAGDIDESVMSVLLGVAKNTYKYVIIDTFPMINELMLSVFDRSDQIVIVTENVVPTLSGTAAMLKVLDQLQIPKDRWFVVLNRYQRLAGSLSASGVADQLGIKIESVIPYDNRVVEAANLGQPIVLGSRWRKSVKTLQKLTDYVLSRLGHVNGHVNGKVNELPVGSGASGTTVREGDSTNDGEFRTPEENPRRLSS